MKKILLCILGFFIIILQNSIINYLSVFGMTINIVLIYLVIISLYLDELESGIIGAVFGIILPFFSSNQNLQVSEDYLDLMD